MRLAEGRVWRLGTSAVALLLTACAKAPSDAAVQACQQLLAQKSPGPIRMERSALQVGAVDGGPDLTLQVEGPFSYTGADGVAHVETLDCRVRLSRAGTDVIHLQVTWSMQELERTQREVR